MLNGKTVLVTGGTGSFGTNFVRMTAENYKPKELIIFSRDEMKQWEMAKEYAGIHNVRFVIGDVRDSARVRQVTAGVDIVVHSAATKIVPSAELDPFECIKTNIIGGMNVIDASIENEVEKVVVLSTDKASNPVSLYGATKFTSDKMFIASGHKRRSSKTQMCVVRYGNVMCSRGSIIPFFQSIPRDQPFPITDPRMTRFMMTLEQGVQFVWFALQEMKGGEIFVRKCFSCNIMDIAEAIRPGFKYVVTGIRDGERIHEQMIGTGESRFAREFDNHYVILPPYFRDFPVFEDIAKLPPVPEEFVYDSYTNKDQVTAGDLRDIIRNI